MCGNAIRESIVCYVPTKSTVTQFDVNTAITALKRGGKSASGVPAAWLAKRCKWDEDYASSVLESLNQQQATPSEPTETREFDGDKQVVTKLSNQRITSLEQLLAFCDVDESEWEVERWVANKWEVGGKDNVGELQVKSLFQIKAWFRRKLSVIATRAEVDAMIEAAKKHAPEYKPFKYKRTSGNLLELDIFDAHFGKLAWGEETGYGDYDTAIAKNRFAEAIEVLVSRTIHHGIGKILFPVGNDLLQTDNRSGTTTSGTYVDTDSRYKKVFRSALDSHIKAGDRLSAIAPVEFVVVPGNHDELSAWALGVALECWYHSNPNITVNNSAQLRKYHEWGKCMQMLAHGNKGKHKDYGLLMATEQPEMFGRTRFREAHVGHLHQDRLTEKYGVVVRILRALCPPDAWHSDNTHVGNQEGAEAFLWNKEEGIIATALYTVTA